MAVRRSQLTALVVASIAVGCAGTDGADQGVPATTSAPDSTVAVTAAPDTDAAEPLTIGLVAPSATDDLAWTQSMFDSINRVADAREIELSVADAAAVVADPGSAMRAFAEDDVDLVVVHGTQFGGALQDIAAQFPDVSFMFGSADDFFGLDNVFAYSADAAGGGYVNGVLAAQLTSTGTVGVVGPVPAGDAEAYIDGFVEGVAARNEDAVVVVEYIDSFSDTMLASEAARALIADGADVLTGTAQMVVGATGVAVDSDVPWLGSQSNQTELGEDVVVASIVYRWEGLLNDVLDRIEEGTNGGEALSISVANGGIELEFNDAYPLDPDVAEAGTAAFAGLVDGTIEIDAGE